MRRIRLSARRSLLGSLLDRGPMLTPLIDIMFLVLIFFMVNNSPAQRSLGVQPPHMPSAPLQEPATERPGTILLLAVRPDFSYSIQLRSAESGSESGGAMRVLGEWHSARPDQGEPDSPQSRLRQLEQLLDQLRSELSKSSPPRRIRLRADRSLDYGSVIAISDLLYRWQLPLDLDVSETDPNGSTAN